MKLSPITLQWLRQSASLLAVASLPGIAVAQPSDATGASRAEVEARATTDIASRAAAAEEPKKGEEEKKKEHRDPCPFCGMG